MPTPPPSRPTIRDVFGSPMRRGAPGLLSLALVALVALVAVGCGGGSTTTAGSITVYSGQHEQTVSALTADFTKRTGIKVALRSGGEGELANQIIQEGDRSPADVFYAGNSPALEALAKRGLLAPVDSATLAAIPSKYNSPTGNWVGVSARASVLAYNTSKVKADALPKSLLALANPEWKGKIAFAPTETDFQPLVTAIGALRGAPAAEQWLRGLKRNAKLYEDNEAIIAAVDRGEVAAGLILHYYWYRFRDEVGAGKIKTALDYFGVGDVGGLVNVSGAAILSSSKRTAEARKFLAYLVSEPGQRVIESGTSYEYLLRPGVVNAKLMRPLATLSPPVIGVKELGDGSGAVALMKRVGLL